LNDTSIDAESRAIIRYAMEINDPWLAEWVRQAEGSVPLGRLGDPLETGGLAVFLASTLSSYMTGQGLISDGGLVHTSARPPIGLGMVAQSVPRPSTAAAPLT